MSTEDQRLGPEAQRATIEAWAAREGVRVLSWHADQGVSGGADIEQRKGLVAALGELRALRAGILVVAKRDRLARDPYVAAMIERAASSCGAKLASGDGVGNGDTASDAFMRSILDAVAAYERAMTRSRTKAALAAKKAQGFRAGSIPFGYASDAEGRLAPCPAEQAVIAEVRRLKGAGMSLRGIVLQCERRGLVSRTGQPLHVSQVGRICRAA